MINTDDHEQILADPKATTDELRSIIAELQATQENEITPGGIERQEAAGQAAFVRNATLPKDCDRETLTKCGIIFCTDADDLFVHVILPDGWKKRATNHPMYSDLLDDKGRVRATIFYKAAFYDRRSDMRMCCRYNINEYETCDADGNDVKYGNHTHFKTVVTDGAASLHSFERIREADDYERSDLHVKQAQEWLDLNYPDWRNPLAYW